MAPAVCPLAIRLSTFAVRLDAGRLSSRTLGQLGMKKLYMSRWSLVEVIVIEHIEGIRSYALLESMREYL